MGQRAHPNVKGRKLLGLHHGRPTTKQNKFVSQKHKLTKGNKASSSDITDIRSKAAHPKKRKGA
jgi:hypothetical protein